jgi:hypothetical protein
MICPKCALEQPDEHAECPRCGIVFEKYHAHRAAAGIIDQSEPLPVVSAFEADAAPPTINALLSDWLFSVHVPVNPFAWGGRAVAFFLLFLWGWRFILSSIESNYVGESFVHLINLPFHEAGHVFFGVVGSKFLMMLGGSLGQVLMPLACLLTFLFKTRDTFGASVALWWCGESLMDLAPYINDARALKLILLGGVTGDEVEDYHDWEFLLRTAGWLRYDHLLAGIVNTIGIGLLLTSFLWGGYVLFRQYQLLRAPC